MLIVAVLVLLLSSCSGEQEGLTNTASPHKTEEDITEANGHALYVDSATGIIWLEDNSILGGGAGYDATMNTISELGDGFRAPDLREFFLSFDYDHPDHVLSHLPIALDKRGLYYRTANRRQDGQTLVVKVDDGDVSKWDSHNVMPLPVAVYGPLSIPEPSFRDRGDGTVEIPEAGLLALRDHVDCFGTLTPPTAIQKVAQLEDGKCGLHDGSLPGDWRMPTMKELAILLGDASRGGGSDPHAFPANIFPKRGVWYGSSNQDATGHYWNLYMTDHPMGYLGDAGPDEPGIPVWVLAVRPN